jgi:hypothetical protein
LRLLLVCVARESQKAKAPVGVHLKNRGPETLCVVDCRRTEKALAVARLAFLPCV